MQGVEALGEGCPVLGGGGRVWRVQVEAGRSPSVLGSPAGDPGEGTSSQRLGKACSWGGSLVQALGPRSLRGVRAQQPPLPADVSPAAGWPSSTWEKLWNNRGPQLTLFRGIRAGRVRVPSLLRLCSLGR